MRSERKAPSAARNWPFLAGFVSAERSLGERARAAGRLPAFAYPNQAAGWSPVSAAKLGSWFLLMIVSYVLVTLVNRPEAMPREAAVEKPAAVPHPAL